MLKFKLKNILNKKTHIFNFIIKKKNTTFEKSNLDNYFNDFPSINSQLSELDVFKLITTKEFLIGNYNLMTKNYKEAEKYFNFLKETTRTDFISSYPYMIILKRLGISKINQLKLKEGLLDLENVYEFSKNENDFDNKLRFNAMNDLLNVSLKVDPFKVILIK
jgi:hypothetical protein